MKKTILFVITKSNWGGAQRYVFDLATNLPKAEFEVVVAFGTEGLLAEKLSQAGIITYHIKSLQRDISVGSDFASIKELYSFFKKIRPDIVHLNSSKAGGVGALAARLAGVPTIVFTAHGWPFWENRPLPIRILIWIFSWITALLSNHIICISNFDLAVARRMPFIGSKAVRIYNGINLHMSLSPGDTIRKHFPTGAHITGTIGELHKNKNQQILIEQAIHTPSMHVAIVGEGELREILEEKVRIYALQERVKLFGFIPAQEVLRGFDLFALPSIKEGLPYVLLEARAAGLPIEASRVGGIPEILDAPDMALFSHEHMIQETLKVYRDQ